MLQPDLQQHINIEPCTIAKLCIFHCLDPDHNIGLQGFTGKNNNYYDPVLVLTLQLTSDD